MKIKTRNDGGVNEKEVVGKPSPQWTPYYLEPIIV